MKSSKSSPSPFEIPNIKNVKVIKTEIKPFLQNIVYNYTKPLSFENEPYSLEIIPLIRELLDTYLFYNFYKSTTVSTEYPSFQITFPQQETSSTQTYRRTINPINLQVHIKDVFHAPLNQVKEFNLALENPKYSPNALQELQRSIQNFEVEDIERIVITQAYPHHWLQTDIIRIQSFLYHYFKDITLNKQSKSQIKLISLFLRKVFRFNYQLKWSEQDQAAFTVFTTHFTADECLPIIINEKNEHPYFFKPDKITKQTIVFISFDPRLITKNNLIVDNRPYRYDQNIQEKQILFTTNENYNENDNNNEDYTLENQKENRNETIVHHINENNTSEYTTPESTTSAQDASQTGTSTKNHFVRVPTRVVSPRPITYNLQSCSDTSPRRIITFNIPSNSVDEIQDETQNIPSFRNTYVDVSSPTRTILDTTQNINTTQNITRSMYDPPSLPSSFKYPNKTIRSEDNNNQQISSRYYDPFNYSFYPQSNTNIHTNNNQNTSQPNNNPNLLTHHSYTHPLSTNSTQTSSSSQNQRIPYSDIVQSSQRQFQNPPLSYISTDPLYQMNQHTTYNPTQISSTVNMAQSVVPPPQYIPIQQDTFIKTSASLPERMKHFDGLDHSYTPEKYLQQVEARLTFAKGEEPQNNPVKYRS